MNNEHISSFIENCRTLLENLFLPDINKNKSFLIILSLAFYMSGRLAVINVTISNYMCIFLNVISIQTFQEGKRNKSRFSNYVCHSLTNHKTYELNISTIDRDYGFRPNLGFRIFLGCKKI